ncbi:hypothetical protein IMG5_051960 [Ichthyophthirius multifiliis]|uniref:Uncharacterized protein n=1 Tax=Ichthyophthirius multifiliis TaxID=5932 RepID=G0QMU5_ICHMU|nr:hypothetical protein IMG5_051960 [Ichthyophthirius multifiliis]EGR33455.1 hypothetical protein IMG5_051960 [Ichthyophthirius multifiliis]|eukprot:XP_004037441.1 hypothetical protein IMG5_051960 [Ichthyophthirius multifiliis]
MSLNQQYIKKNLKQDRESIVFTSEDSFYSDNSFNQSLENDNNNDFKNTLFHLKEQMNQFFQVNPELQDHIKYDNIQNQMKNEIKHIQSTNTNQQNLNDQEKKQKEKELKNKSQLWSKLSNTIIRNSRFQQKIPSLDTLNHRLNVYHQNIEKIDYLEVLQNEISKQSQKQNKEKGQEKNFLLQQNYTGYNKTKSNYNQNKDSFTEEEQQFDLNREVKYYSYKKKMEVLISNSLYQQNIQLVDQQYQSKKSIIYKLNNNNKNIIDIQNNNNNNLNHNNDIILKLKQQFQTKIGKQLLIAVQQSKGDKEQFKKIAQNILKEYDKNKQNILKNNKFPPNIPKFIQEENRALNQLLPDFSNLLSTQNNKIDPFELIKDYQPETNSQEYQQMQLIEKLSNGKIITQWKYQINN